MSLVKGIAFSFLIMIGYTMVSSLFTLSILTDKKEKMHYIQRFMGITSVNYWFGTFLSDFIQIIFPTVVFLLFIVIFDVKTLASSWG